ncbi:hypothetical protein [Paenibacillus sp. y28]|uniref:hypothetical protein n=1 Tax=Paenibacillus sp. y28 TaxID=3129110 RepID=UPI003017F775
MAPSRRERMKAKQKRHNRAADNSEKSGIAPIQTTDKEASGLQQPGTARSKADSSQETTAVTSKHQTSRRGKQAQPGRAACEAEPFWEQLSPEWQLLYKQAALLPLQAVKPDKSL